MSHQVRRCPSCDSTNMHAGELGHFGWWSVWFHRFFPMDVRSFSGFPLLHFVCRDCGLLSQYVAEEHLRKLKSSTPKTATLDLR